MWKRSALIVSAALVVGALLAPPASASKQSGKSDLEGVDYGEKDGDWAETWIDEQDREWTIIYQNYTVVDVIGPGSGDPDPDSDGSDRGDLSTVIQILKQHGGSMVLDPVFGKTPLGLRLTRQGRGIIPVYNPSDVGFQDGDSGTGGGFDPGAGSPEQQLKRQASKGNKDGGKGDDGSDLKRGDVGLFDDDMPGPPPLVNPNPVLIYGKSTGSTGSGDHTAGGMHDSAKAGGAAGRG